MASVGNVKFVATVRTFILVAAFGLLGGCSSHYVVNEPLARLRLPTDQNAYAVMNPRLRGPSDEIFLVLTFSGGGTRAAAFSYGVLEELAVTTVTVGGKKTRLLDEVDMISSVSGGSFTAAYFGLFGDRIFQDFETKFLDADVQGKLTSSVLSPVSWPLLASPWYGRSELAEDIYDRLLFEGKTFQDLLDAGPPAILINATDVELGAQFTFLDLQFALMCSDLMRFPVSRAVTASSAVPLLFNSIVLKNRAEECEVPLPPWADEVLARRETYSRQYQQAVRRLSYRDQNSRPYVHLLDGGLSDNLGVRALLDNVFVRGGAWQSLRLAKLEQTKKVVIILVNSEAEIDLSAAKRDVSIPLLDTILAASSVPLDHYTFETVELLRDQLDRWREEVPAKRCAEAYSSDIAGCDGFETYLVEVTFSSLPDPAERDRLKVLPTSFRLASEDVDALRDAARRVVRQSPAFKRLIDDLAK